MKRESALQITLQANGPTTPKDQVLQDPFYNKQKRKKETPLLEADAWLDSSLYDFFQSMGNGYTKFQDVMSVFHVYGLRRWFVEIVSDGFNFLAIGLVLMTALALSAFQATAFGEFNKVDDYSVIFLDRYGNEIGRRGIRTDDSFELEQLPDNLIKATLATEDRRFYEHFGIDVLGTLRALLSNVQAQSVVEGGSSITQQLAKNLFLSSEQTLERKITEAFLSLWLEAYYTKDEILKLYFDRAYMGGGNFGVAAATEYYFNKSVVDLTLAEAAMLGGLFKAPSGYAPHIDLAAARGRANVVLTNMVQAGYMTEGQVTAARRLPAQHIERFDEIESPNYFLDWAFEDVKQLVAESSEIGFIVRTTIDPVLQSYAEQAVSSIIRENGEAYGVDEAAIVVTEPSGAVRAMVGGLDYGKSQFNRATASARQPGSSFKPFVYATAFEMLDYTPSTVIRDRPVCIGNWCPKNYNRSYAGNVTLMNALTRSINTIPVTLSVRTGRGPIADMAHTLGITSDFPVTRSLALGVASVSVIDMTSAYGVFANGGLKSTAQGISSITSLRGETVYKFDADMPHERLISAETASYINSMLRNVVTSGTGRRANVEGVPAAGKTGTTQSYRDAWFAGYTGNYVPAVWMGNDNYRPTRRLTGGRLPAMIWQKFMEFAHTNIEIKPLFGVDFIPRKFDQNEDAEDDQSLELQRPPSLTAMAAQKLLQLNNIVAQELRDQQTGIEVKSITETFGPVAQNLPVGQ
ncbi:MAG: PBP1A family penicillin-binding protein [Devosiaceae bacterium]|nr:PBP1A family penicillin-binding protein [Devosiaceae bacterium]